jgi:hypothetical protein
MAPPSPSPSPSNASIASMQYGVGPGCRDDMCAICLVEIGSDDPSCTHGACKNTYHSECFDRWYGTTAGTSRDTVCPMCREILISPTLSSQPPSTYENELARQYLTRVLNLPPGLIFTERGPHDGPVTPERPMRMVLDLGDRHPTVLGSRRLFRYAVRNERNGLLRRTRHGVQVRMVENTS